MPPEVATLTRIRRAALDQMLAHVRATPARESCGALLGRVMGEARTIEQAVPVVNQADDVWHGFLIPAERVRRLERDAHTEGLEVVGFYHSHPDGSREPSARDVADAWPWYTYVIVPLDAPDGAVAAWRLRADRSRFDPEAFECTR